VEILICTDGSNLSIQSADLVAMLAFPPSTRVVVLGVSESEVDVEDINHSMDLLEKKLSGKYSVIRKIRYGNPADEILSEAVETSYNLVVLGGGSRQLGILHSQLGSTTSQLSRKLHTHFLVARNIPDELRKILICVGGEAPASETMSLGGAWIANTSAQIGLLHVIPLRKTRVNVETRIGGDDKEPFVGDKRAPDSALERASQQLGEAGVKNAIVPRARQGLIVDEVLLELSEGAYDLLVVGAHYQPGQDRWTGTLFDDITDQLLNRSNCSVLII
jgi:nucleotide-binding universal stress UspA family protein